MKLEEELVALLNEMLEGAKNSTKVNIAEVLTAETGWLKSSNPEFPDDIILSSDEDGMVRLSMLSVLNTALARTGTELRIVGVTEGRYLEQVRLAKFPLEN